MLDVAAKLGERVRRLRKAKGLSQERLAELAGLHTNYVGQVERGEKNLTLDTLQKIVSGLDITLEELFRYVDPMKKKDAIGLIVELLAERPIQDQQMALKVLKTVLEWGGGKG